MYEPILHEEFSILNASELCKILGDYNRMRLLLLLSDAQERTISEITVKLQSSQSLVSHQVRLLKEVHILTTRKSGKYVYCKITDTGTKVPCVAKVHESRCQNHRQQQNVMAAGECAVRRDHFTGSLCAVSQFRRDEKFPF